MVFIRRFNLGASALARTPKDTWMIFTPEEGIRENTLHPVMDSRFLGFP
jgi:hypothetical protein